MIVVTVYHLPAYVPCYYLSVVSKKNCLLQSVRLHLWHRSFGRAVLCCRMIPICWKVAIYFFIIFCCSVAFVDLAQFLSGLRGKLPYVLLLVTCDQQEHS